MNTAKRIESVVTELFQPEHCELQNESHMHAGPATESHFKLVLVSAHFEGLKRVQRHQKVYGALRAELQSAGSGTVHALALQLFTPAEWLETQVPESPLCAGKNI